MAGVMSNEPALQLECTTHFRKLLSIERNPPIDEVIATGVVPRFVQFLSFHHDPQLQFEAAWALEYIASGSSNGMGVVVQGGAVPVFVQLLASQNDSVKEKVYHLRFFFFNFAIQSSKIVLSCSFKATQVLGNIAGHSVCRDFVLQHGALGPLLQNLMESSKLSMLRNATFTLSKLCQGKPPQLELVGHALPIIARLIYSTDEEILADACQALSYLSEGGNERIQAVLEAGVSRRIVELLM